MNRREALRLLASSAALPLAPRSLLAVMRQARAVLGTPAASGTLNPHQSGTVKTMAELILPRTDTPGATDVGVTEFIDLILTEWYDEAQRTAFLQGIADVDTRTQALFSKDFVDSTPSQQTDILQVLGEKMIEEAEAMPNRTRSRRGSAPLPEKNFYAMLRRLTLTAYFTSEAGATAALNYQIIPDRHSGCVEIQPAKGGSGSR